MLHLGRSEVALAYDVQITAPAKTDAQEYAQFIGDKERSYDAAKLWLDGLQSEINKLSDMPSKFAVIPEAEELGTPYRSFNYHSHRVIYAVDEEGKTVTVHRVYHCARKPLSTGDLH
jgi:plasmid stabilization system protein ParE